MERHNRPPPLALPASPPAHLSALRYQHIHSSRPIMPPYVSSRRRLNRGIFAPLNSVAGVLFLTALLVTGSLTWFLTRAGTDRVSSPLSQLPDWPRQKAPNDILPNRFEPKDTEVANQTLNFQKIFAINLPSRLDRRDLLSIMSTVSDLAITIVPGVRTVAENSIPPPRIPGSLRMEEYAVWRAHANVWRRVIEEGLTTALILEDDNDWDVNLKEQIPRILHALEDIRKPPADTEDAVVRGGIRSEGWDMLYLGSCWEIPKTTDEYNRTTFIPIYGDAENIAQHNYNWVPSNPSKREDNVDCRWKISLKPTDISIPPPVSFNGPIQPNVPIRTL